MFTFHMFKWLTNRHNTISEKIITFCKHLKSENNEVVVLGMIPRGDFY